MIRRARMGDRFAMVRMARDFMEESGLQLPFDPAWAEAAAKAWIADTDKLALVLDLDGVCGMLCAAHVPSPLAPVRVASEQVFWLDHSARGRAAMRHAGALLRAYRDWAEAEGCRIMGMAALTGQRTGALYERHGFTAAETYYMRVLT